MHSAKNKGKEEDLKDYFRDDEDEEDFLMKTNGRVRICDRQDLELPPNFQTYRKRLVKTQQENLYLQEPWEKLKKTTVYRKSKRYANVFKV